MAKHRGDAGMVTAEFAVTMPAIVLILVTVINVGQAVTTKIGCIDAARAGARAAARGESEVVIREAAGRAADQPISIWIERGTELRILVRGRVRLLPPFGWEPEVQCQARAPAEATDRGSATILTLALVVFGIALAWSILILGQARLARHAAESAADLAALAAADRVLGRAPGPACPGAAASARKNLAQITHCEVDGTSVLVRVALRPAEPAGRFGMAIAWARAGAPDHEGNDFSSPSTPGNRLVTPSLTEALSPAPLYANVAILASGQEIAPSHVEVHSVRPWQGFHLANLLQKSTKGSSRRCHPMCRSPPEYWRLPSQ